MTNAQTSEAPPPPAGRAWLPALASALLVAALAFGVYYESLSNGYAYDDFLVIAGNGEASRWPGWRAFFTPRYFDISREISYRPVCTLSYYLDYFVLHGAGRPNRSFTHHVVNNLLHAANAVLLMWLAAALGMDRRASLAAALLFAVHPAASEAVCLIGFREDLLALGFACAALLARTAALRTRGAARPGAWAAMLLMAGLGLLSKETVMLLPALALVCDYAAGPPVAPRRARWNTIIALALLSAAYALVRFDLLTTPYEVALPLWSGDRWNAFLGACNILVLYGRLLLLPFGLTLEHVPPTGQQMSALHAALAVAAVALALAAAAWAWRRCRPAAFAALWFGLWIAPVCHIVPIANPMAERFLYAPLAGAALLAGLAFAPFLRRPWPGAKLLALLVISLAVLTIQRVPAWRNDRTISLAASRVDPQKASRSLDNLGDVTRELTGKEKIRTANARAENLFRRAIVADPENYNAWNNLGILAGQLRQYDKAAPLLQKALSILETKPHYPWSPSNIHHQLGVVLWNLNRRDEAVKHFEEAVHIWPENQKAQGDLVKARQALERKKPPPNP